MLDDFLLKNWFDLLQSVFIAGGLRLSYLTNRNDRRSQQLENLLQLNESYREIWNKTYSHPELLRIRKTDLDLDTNPITAAEQQIVIEVIIHMYAVYEAIQNEQLDKGEMGKDISDFLNLPIPNTIWQKVKIYHKKQFVRYVDRLLAKIK